MLLTKARFDPAKSFLTGAHIRAVGQKLLNASVMLNGPAKGGGGETFIGSATILGPGTEVAYSGGKWTPTGKHFTVVVTCKHSLYTQGNGNKIPDTGGSPNAAKWEDDLITSFKAVTIRYDDAGANDFGSNLTKSAAVDHVVPLFEENYEATGKTIVIPGTASSDGKSFPLVNLTGTTTPDGSGSKSGLGGISPEVPANGWAYDVMLLLSKDASLYAFASDAAKCGYQSALGQDDLLAALGPDYGNAPYDGSIPLLRRDKQLVQVGFGTTSEQLLPKGKTSGAKITLPATPNAGAQYQRLQYKLSVPSAQNEAATFYESLPGNSGELTLANTHGFVLGCDMGNNSTNSGDSGGGVFGLDAAPTADATSAILAAVTTGSAAATSARDAATMWDFDNNVVTSLHFYYQNLFDLRYQNV